MHASLVGVLLLAAQAALDSAVAVALQDADSDVRVLACWALGEIEDESGVEPLVAALKDREIDVRVAAAWALGEIESPRALDALEAAQQDESSAVRRAATWALRQIDDDDARVRVRPRVKIKS
jgi:HEAT repeat protein